MTYRVNKQECRSCQACVQACPEAMRMGSDGKAEITDQKKLGQCGGENICPVGVIQKISE